MEMPGRVKKKNETLGPRKSRERERQREREADITDKLKRDLRRFNKAAQMFLSMFNKEWYLPFRKLKLCLSKMLNVVNSCMWLCCPVVFSKQTRYMDYVKKSSLAIFCVKSQETCLRADM